MQETARRIARVSRESRLPLDETEYVSSFKVELMDAVLKWCQGAKFVEICKVSKTKQRVYGFVPSTLSLTCLCCSSSSSTVDRYLRRISDQNLQASTRAH